MLPKHNTKIIPIEIFGFLWHVAVYMTFPFMTLQMLNIGLNMEDVSIVYGLVPLVTFLAAPLSGHSHLRRNFQALVVLFF